LNMVLEFKVSNFRSFKTEQVFSFVAETTKSKPNNVFEAQLPKGTSVRLLKSAVIYGANASGKSNFLQAFYALRRLVTTSDSNKIDQPIDVYEPFLLDKTSDGQPTKFEITFIGKDSVKYRYAIAYTRQNIVHEVLDYYPNGQVANLFTRDVSSGDYHEISPGKKLARIGWPHKTLVNHLILSRFGGLEPHEQLNDIYRFFDNINIANALDPIKISSLVEKLGKEISKSENREFADRLSRLIRVADTNVEEITIGKAPIAKELESMLTENPQLSDVARERLTTSYTRFQVLGKHRVYHEGKEAGTIDLDFKKNISVGTNAMFALGGMILKQFEKGGLVVFDELDNSLHPKITRFFIQLFHNPNINKANAQIIFSTHEPLLMDKDMFRSDQIWFTQKNRFGETELYSAQDFDGVREDIPFDKWYMAGKFGALPKILESEFTF